MKIKNFCLILITALFMVSSLAVAKPVRRNPAFVTPKGLQPRVNFWIDIFTRYGEHNEVLHHRAYPQVVFKVLDFYKVAGKLSDVALAKFKKSEVKKQVGIVKAAVKNLADGKVPQNPLEKHIASQMAFLGKGTAKYKELLKDDMIRSQQGIKERYREAMERAALYLPHIENIFVNEYHLPVELTRLPFVESSFNYSARSSVGAAGIWQFMPATARSHKMMVNSIVDERLDVTDATRAAAQYLQHAYEVLESWPLAVTSYNHGVVGVAKKVKTLGTRDITSIVEHRTQRLLGFASNNFYPELLAAITVYENKSKYFPNLALPHQLSFIEYKLPYPATVGYITRQLHVSVHDLMPLNYALLSPIWTGRYSIPKGYNLKIPTASRRYIGNLSKPDATATVPTYGYGSLTYKVRKGDTLISLARKYNVTVAQIKRLNGLKSDVLRLGQSLVIKGGSQPVQNTSVKNTSRAGAPTFHVVKSGDTVSGIARRYGVTAAQLKQANGMRNDVVVVGKKLSIPGGRTASSSPSPVLIINKGGTYTAKAGDTLYSIAHKNGMKVEQLKALNGLKSDVIKQGQVLKLSLSNRTPGRTSGAGRYTVRSGDTLWGISKKTGVSVANLQRLNNIKGNTVKVGQSLALR